MRLNASTGVERTRQRTATLPVQPARATKSRPTGVASRAMRGEGERRSASGERARRASE